MAGKALINVNFEKAFKQADELEKIARSLEKTGKVDLADCMTEISANWTGENADNYVKKGGKVRSDIAENAKKLKKAAEAIREIAKTYKKAEEDADNIANIRTYNK